MKYSKMSPGDVAKAMKWAGFELAELGQLSGLFGEQDVGSPFARMFDEVWAEVKLRADDGDFEAEVMYDNGPYAGEEVPS